MHIEYKHNNSTAIGSNYISGFKTFYKVIDTVDIIRVYETVQLGTPYILYITIFRYDLRPTKLSVNVYIKVSFFIVVTLYDDNDDAEYNVCQT